MSRGRTVFVFQRDGHIEKDNSVEGLYIYDTRVLSRYDWRINGKRPQFSCGSNIRQSNWVAYFIQAPENWKKTPEKNSNPLQETDLFSGWGIRTLSSSHPAYNPFSYHRGSVWPVENAAFVLTFSRYGLHGEMHRLAKAMFEAADLFEHDRLPEVFGGHQRTPDAPFPGLYTRACWPQAWSASAPLSILQALVGIYPYAPANVLFLDPQLPEWLAEIAIEGMRIGKASVSIGFFRNAKGKTQYKILDIEGSLHVIHQPSPWSITSGWAERVHDAVMSLIPHPRTKSA
ncbi:MAG: glycogen debranching N-terminal domain-containing protein [Candidatus Acidiferrales bacterium]